MPVISKFVNIVVNGISQKEFDIKAFSQDPESVKKRTNYATSIAEDMFAREQIALAQKTLGIDASQSNIPPPLLPQTKEELELHMQLSYKQSIEIAEEEAISSILAQNKYDLTRKRLNMDLTVLGIAVAKTGFNTAEGVLSLIHI